MPYKNRADNAACSRRFYDRHQSEVRETMRKSYYTKRLNNLTIDWSLTGEPFRQIKMGTRGRPRVYA